MKKTKIFLLLKLLPFITMILFMVMRIGQSTYQFTDTNQVWQEFEACTALFKFQPIRNIIRNALTTTALGVNYVETQSIISNLMSWHIMIELLEIVYTVFEFLPKYINQFFNKERKIKR